MAKKSDTPEITKRVLARNKWRVFNGSFTLRDVMREVRKESKGAKTRGILAAIEEFGPIGEGDVAWFENPIQSRWYDPKTRQPRR